MIYVDPTNQTSHSRCCGTDRLLADLHRKRLTLRRYSHRVAVLFWLAACHCGVPTVKAQSSPDTTLQIQRDEEKRQQLRRRMETAPSIQLQQPAMSTSDRLPQEPVCRQIHSVRAEPALLRHLELDQALAGPLLDDAPTGRCIGVEGLKLLAQRAQNALVNAGFITSRVDVRPQDLRDGNLVLSVTPGRIGEIRPLRDSAPASWHSSTLTISTGEVLNLRDIEQSLENLRREGSAEVNIQIIPGKVEGSSDIVIEHQREDVARMGWTLDDSGSQPTGKELVNATFSLRNLLGWSELAYVNLGRNLLDRSKEPRGSHSYTVHADLPMGYWLLGFTAGANASHQTVVGPFQSYRYSGESQSMELQVSRVLQRDALGKTTLTLSGFARRSQNFIDDTEVQVQRRRTGGWELIMSRGQRLADTITETRLRYRRGTRAFGAQPAPEEAFGEGTSRMQILQAGLQVQSPSRLADWPVVLNSELRLQWHRTPLTPQDRMCLGGRYTVRGFEDSQAVCGSSGQLWRNEVSTQILGLPVIGYAGVDLGRVTERADAARLHQTLAGTFAGLRGPLPFGAGQWDIYLGAPLKKPGAQHPSRAVAWFQVSGSI